MTTMTRSLFTTWVVLASTILSGFAFDSSFPRRKLPATSILFHQKAWRLYLQQECGIENPGNNPIDSEIGADLRGSEMAKFEEVEALEVTLSTLPIESTSEIIDNALDFESNNTETTEIIQPSLPDSVAQIIDAFVTIKEKVYGIIRQILSDLVTIIQRSAKKARDWAVEDDVGQLVSSGLAIVGFYILVAAFAAWNIELLSGGKSKWSGPKNGVTVPVVRGLPNTSEVESTIRFQKPKWKAPKIQTSYSNPKEEMTETLENKR